MIPQEAIEAAAKAQYENDGLAWDDGMVPDWECEDDSLQESYRAAANAAIEAAAPFIRAQALEVAADEFSSRLPDGTGNGRAYNSYRVAELLRARAATERGQG
jgi:hypothetical protein